MSKVQVDTIVDKDDISAPTLSKGAIVTGVCTATTFVGAVTGDVTGNADTATTATNAQGLTGTPSITVTDVNAAGVTTTGIGTVTTSVVVGSAVTANSDGVITSGIITATSFSGSGANLTGITQTTINNNANNLLITGSGTANTLEAESQLTYDGTNFQLKKTGSSDYNEIIQDANPSSENGTLGYLSGYWNTERVADIRFAAGDDTSNKNNAQICFRTTNEGQGNVTDRLRIGNFGQIGLPVGPVGTAATDWGASGQVFTSGGSSAAPSWTTPAGGGWVPLDSTTTTSSDTYAYESTNILSNNTTYQQFRIEFYIRMQGLGKVHLYQYDSGAWQADGSNYVWENRVANGNSNAWTHTTSSGAQGEIPIANNNMYVHQGSVTIWNPNLTTVQATWISECKGWYGFQNWSPSYDVENQNMDYCTTIAEREIGSGSPVAVDGFRLKPSASISGCYVTVYGLKTA